MTLLLFLFLPSPNFAITVIAFVNNSSTLNNTITQPRFYQKYKELRERIKANSCPVLPASPLIKSASECENNKSDKESVVKTTANYIIQRSASLKDYRSQLLR